MIKKIVSIATHWQLALRLLMCTVATAFKTDMLASYISI